MPFEVQVYQGCVRSWKTVVKGTTMTVAQLRSQISAAPQAFTGSVESVDFRLSAGGDALAETFELTASASKVFAKKRVAVSTKSSAKAKKPAASTKTKVKETELVVPMPAGAQPASVTQKGATLMLHFASVAECDDFLESMCDEYDVNLASIKEQAVKNDIAAQRAALEAQLEELNKKEAAATKTKLDKAAASSAAAAAAEEDEGEEAEEEADVEEEADEEEEKEEQPEKEQPKKELPKQRTVKISKETQQKINELASRGMFVDNDIALTLASSDEEDVKKPIAAKKKAFEPKRR